MAAISVNAVVSIANGPKVTINQTMAVEAYDRIEVLLKANTAKLEVDPLPGGKDKVQFLLITADWYGDELSFKLDDANGAASFLLDSPHILPGKGASAMYYALSPKKLLFANSKAVDANIQILVGRDATA